MITTTLQILDCEHFISVNTSSLERRMCSKSSTCGIFQDRTLEYSGDPLARMVQCSDPGVKECGNGTFCLPGLCGRNVQLHIFYSLPPERESNVHNPVPSDCHARVGKLPVQLLLTVVGHTVTVSFFQDAMVPRPTPVIAPS